MISFAPFSAVAGQATAQATPSRVSSDVNPGQSAQAEGNPSTRATVRAQAVTSADPVPRVRAELEEGPGSEARRVNLSTQEFIARRRLRAEKRSAEASHGAQSSPTQRATRTFKTLSEQTAFEGTGPSHVLGATFRSVA